MPELIVRKWDLPFYYTIFYEYGLYKARRGDNAEVQFSDPNKATVFQNAINVLEAAGGGTIYSKVEVPYDSITYSEKIFIIEDYQGSIGSPYQFPYSCIVHKPDPDVEYYEAYKNIGRKYTCIKRYDLASPVIQQAINALTPGRMWKEKVVLKGEFTLTDGLNLPSYLVLDLTQAKIKLADNVNKTVICAENQTDIEVIGGEIDGNKANQSSAPGHGMLFDYCENILVISPKIHDCFEGGLVFGACRYFVAIKPIVYNCRLEMIYLTGADGECCYGTIYSPNVSGGLGIKFVNDVHDVNVYDIYGVETNRGILTEIMDTSYRSPHDCKVIGGTIINDVREAIRLIGETPAGNPSTVDVVRRFQVKDVNVFDASQANPGVYDAVILHEAEECELINLTVRGSTHRYDIRINANNNRVIGGRVYGLGAGIFWITGIGNIVKDVEGYPTVNKGTATIPNGSSSVVVDHGLAAAPSVVKLTGTHSEVKDCWVTNVTSTQFTINAPAAVSANRNVYWQAEV